MTTRSKTDLAKLPPIAPETNPKAELVGDNTGDGLTLQEWTVKLTPIEENFARLFVLYNNATRAYIEASNSTAKRSVARVMAWEMGHRPHVRKRVQEYYSLAAAATVIDYAAILENDRQIVEGFKHADEITQHIHECCRYCHGTEHRYQWRDFEEYLDALKRVDLENDKRRELGQRELSQPSDSGGYGFDPQAEPNLFCPRCEGRGISVNVIADTTKLQGPARAIVKGIKVTANGAEVVFHDVDKAKERLLRAGGILKDDAASVARGAAAGAAAGATAAIAAAKAADSMTLDEAQRLYQQLA
jgi:phage terminase small subunit